jgi:serine/threonine protein kinase
VDIFAFGVTAYRMLTNEHPWDSVDTTGIGALVHDTRDATSIFRWRPDLNEKLGRAVERCLRVVPDERPSSMKQFLAMISDVQSETTI